MTLSQAGVQGHVTRVNLLVSLENVANAVRSDDMVELRSALRDKALNIGKKVRNDRVLEEGEVLKKEVILDAIESANLLGGERE